MAIKVKEGKTFNPSMSIQCGVDMTAGTYYGVIDMIDYDKKSERCYFRVEIYSNKSCRDSKATPVEVVPFNWSGEAFLSEIGNDGLSIPQAYVKALEHPRLEDFESDEVVEEQEEPVE